MRYPLIHLFMRMDLMAIMKFRTGPIDPSDNVMRAELKKIIDAAIQTLPHKYRACI